MGKTSETLKAFTRQMAYFETKIRQETIISQKSLGHVNIETYWDRLPESCIETIRAQEESLWRGKIRVFYSYLSSALFIFVQKCSIHIWDSTTHYHPPHTSDALCSSVCRLGLCHAGASTITARDSTTYRNSPWFDAVSIDRSWEFEFKFKHGQRHDRGRPRENRFYQPGKLGERASGATASHWKRNAVNCGFVLCPEFRVGFQMSEQNKKVIDFDLFLGHDRDLTPPPRKNNTRAVC